MRVTDVYHNVICRHQVEIEVWPPRAEVHFGDDWTANPADMQVRFEAIVYNSAQGYLWDVRKPDGSPGDGTIDASGVYHAPAKGPLASGSTEIVIATAREDSLRKAYAWVTLVGQGPEPVPAPSIDIFPKRVNLYFRQNYNNSYIDDCNKMRAFNAILRDGVGTIEWLVGGVLQGATGPWFLYQMPNNGVTGMIAVSARLQGRPAVFDAAEVLQLNYVWPGA